MMEQPHIILLPYAGNFAKGYYCPERVIDFGRPITLAERMSNRLKKFRARAKMTQLALADAVGTGKSTIVKLERGERPLSIAWMNRLAVVLDCEPTDLLNDEVAIVGRIGAGGSIVYEDVGNGDVITRPPETSGSLVGLEVDGESMLPKFDPGDIVFVSREQDGVNPVDIGAYCAVRLRAGETYLKILARGSSPGRYTLRSLNAADMEDVEVEWATPVRAITPRAARRF